MTRILHKLGLRRGSLQTCTHLKPVRMGTPQFWFREGLAALISWVAHLKSRDEMVLVGISTLVSTRTCPLDVRVWRAEGCGRNSLRI